MKKVAKIMLDGLLCTILIFFFITFFFVLIELFHYKFDPSVNGYKNLYNIVMEYVNIYYALILIITIYLALFNYMAIKQDKHERLKIAQGDFMLTLRKMFYLHEDIHVNFRGDKGDWVNGIPLKDRTNENYAKIDSYLGLFELCYQLIKRDLIDLNEFNDIYGYRLRNLFCNKSILEKIELERSNWTDLLELKEKIGIKP